MHTAGNATAASEAICIGQGSEKSCSDKSCLQTYRDHLGVGTVIGVRQGHIGIYRVEGLPKLEVLFLGVP